MIEVDFGALQRQVKHNDALAATRYVAELYLAQRATGDAAFFSQRIAEQTSELAGYLATQLQGQPEELRLQADTTREVPIFGWERTKRSLRASGWMIEHTVGGPQELSGSGAGGRHIGGRLLQADGEMFKYGRVLPTGKPGHYNLPNFVVIDEAPGIKFGSIGKHGGSIAKLTEKEIAEERTQVGLVRLATRHSISLDGFKPGARRARS